MIQVSILGNIRWIEYYLPVNLSNTPMNVFLSPSLRMLLYRDGRLDVVVTGAAAVLVVLVVIAVAVADCEGIADTEGIGVGGVELVEVSCCCCCSSSSSGMTKVTAEARADRKAVSLGGIGDEEEDMERVGEKLMRFENGKRKVSQSRR